MESLINLKLDASQEIPIYRQIADAITTEVRSGRMEYGTKLPTVRELSDALDIAIGTIKRAYDELESSGIISKARGRGTFVSWTDDNSRSRKDRAMDAIDSTLDLMEELRFSQTEISIFLDLKMRERRQRFNGINVAAVECCPETVAMLKQSLYSIEGAEVFTQDLQQALAYPQDLQDKADIAVTAAAHYPSLLPLMEDGRVMPAAMELTPTSIASLARLKKSRCAILSVSEKFGALAAEAAAKYAPQVQVVIKKTLGDLGKLEDILRNVDVLIVPAGIAKYCDADTARQLKSFGEEKIIAEIAYRADEGSLLYIARRIKALQTGRKQKTF